MGEGVVNAVWDALKGWVEAVTHVVDDLPKEGFCRLTGRPTLEGEPCEGDRTCDCFTECGYFEGGR